MSTPQPNPQQVSINVHPDHIADPDKLNRIFALIQAFIGLGTNIAVQFTPPDVTKQIIQGVSIETQLLPVVSGVVTDTLTK